MWNSFDVPAPCDCSSAIKPKVEHRPIFLPAIPFLVEPIGCWASTVARLQEELANDWCGFAHFVDLLWRHG